MTLQRINEAFNLYPRKNFLPDAVRSEAKLDVPLPIGYDQTNSQPSTVRRMLSWLDVQLGDNVLDVGSGSGWTTALLSHLVGEPGKVYAVERIPELVRFGVSNCKDKGVSNVSFHSAGETLGLPDHAPYGRILVSATAKKLPQELIDQLATGGRMVIPVQNSILVIEKQQGGKQKVIEHPGYAFVPLL